MIYLYSIIEGLFFTDFFSHSEVRTYSWTPKGVKINVYQRTERASTKGI